ncbi:MAG TPA: DUF3842 family protein [Bacillota bacterium]|nr:DUF3842 family protein [Bacillota bacterium]
MKILIIDGQGGGMGGSVVAELKAKFPQQDLVAIGTNSIATSVMLKAGADYGATGENPVVYNAKDADIIIGPIGIVLANSLLGELTPQMATAVSGSKAKKMLIPTGRCNCYVAGTKDLSLSQYLAMIIDQVRPYIDNQL